MSGGRGTAKHWNVIPKQDLLERLADLESRHDPCVLHQLADYAQEHNDSDGIVPLGQNTRRRNRKASSRQVSLSNAVMELKEPIEIAGVPQEGKPLSLFFEMKQVYIVREARTTLRSALNYHLTELYYLIKNSMFDKDRVFSETQCAMKIDDLLRQYQINKICSKLGSWSCRAAMTATGNWLPSLSGQNYDIHEGRRAAVIEKLNYTEGDEAFEAELNSRMELISLLAMSFERAENYKSGFSKIKNANIPKEELPSRELFIERLFNASPPKRAQSLEIALHGLINPADLWQTVEYARDLLDVAVFVGRWALGAHGQPSRKIGKTFLHEVKGVAPQTPCDPAAVSARQWLADAILAYLSDHALDDVCAKLRAAAG